MFCLPTRQLELAAEAAREAAERKKEEMVCYGKHDPFSTDPSASPACLITHRVPLLCILLVVSCQLRFASRACGCAQHRTARQSHVQSHV